VDISKPSHMRI